MKIYTSYFAKIRKFPENIMPIAICRMPPAGYTGVVYKALAPSYDILFQYKANPDEKLYTERYNKEILDKIDLKSVIEELERISHGKDIALICFEKSSDFCHRHIVADKLKAMGYDVTEFNT